MSLVCWAILSVCCQATMLNPSIKTIITPNPSKSCVPVFMSFAFFISNALYRLLQYGQIRKTMVVFFISGDLFFRITDNQIPLVCKAVVHFIENAFIRVRGVIEKQVGAKHNIKISVDAGRRAVARLIQQIK